MASPNDGRFDWKDLDPDQPGLDPVRRAEAERQTRLLRAAGKSELEIRERLRQAGLSTFEAAAFVEHCPRQSDRWERFFSRASLVFIGLQTLYVIWLVLVKQPWDETHWLWSYRSARIPSITGFIVFCGLYPAAMVMVWFGAVCFGGMLDRMTRKKD